MEQNELDFIKNFGGKEYSYEHRSSYEKWSLDFFHDKEIVADPLLQMTLQLNLTKAVENFNLNYKKIEGASFTAFLMWHLINSTNKHPYFRYRKINEKWYIFDHLPLFSPVAIGGDLRFKDLILNPPSKYSLVDFLIYYRETLNETLNKKEEEFTAVDPTLWFNSWFVGNLPNLQFTGFTLHKSAVENGRPYFYFGKRYQQGNETMIPLLINFDHSNLDPFVISSFMEDFQAGIEGR